MVSLVDTHRKTSVGVFVPEKPLSCHKFDISWCKIIGFIYKFPEESPKVSQYDKIFRAKNNWKMSQDILHVRNVQQSIYLFHLFIN